MNQHEEITSILNQITDELAGIQTSALDALVEDIGEFINNNLPEDEGPITDPLVEAMATVGSLLDDLSTVVVNLDAAVNLTRTRNGE